jgi:hypothetical protein
MAEQTSGASAFVCVALGWEAAAEALDAWIQSQR